MKLAEIKDMTLELGQRTTCSSTVEVFTFKMFAYFINISYFMKFGGPYLYFRFQLYNKLCFI